MNNSNWPIDGTLTGTTDSGQSGPECSGNEEELSAVPKFQDVPSDAV